MNHQPVFLDASFWISLRDEQDIKHRQTASRTGELVTQRLGFVTTPLVLAETHAYFTRAPRRRQQILDDVERNPIIRCESFTPQDQAEAIRLLRQHRDKSYSFCDAVSFVVMRRLGLTRVATFDEHFRQFGGFEVLC
jgi:predicted nucleic acid-binding protein